MLIFHLLFKVNFLRTAYAIVPSFSGDVLPNDRDLLFPIEPLYLSPGDWSIVLGPFPQTTPTERGKSSWPELLGQSGDIAVATIERENPLVTAIIVPPETVVIPTFQCDRVWVYVDDNNNVIRVPTIG
ncbi:Proteinase inhibitor [Sesamum angolense]|uniref:Proteinase inhibitor n=1 Tax=Sesamum angolense TaxID=2727404 RepID=A0AAE1WVN9_9LAMI|nr:Proteinase inhibitor [Sesamum angolense]